MAYLVRPLGFTPDEEKEVLLAARSRADEKIESVLEIMRKQDQLRMLTAGAAVLGMLFTLTKFGELIAALRSRRTL